MNTQTRLHLGMATTHLTLEWKLNIFRYRTRILTVLGPLVYIGNNIHNGLNNIGPQDREEL